jgi:hypothetical protein
MKVASTIPKKRTAATAKLRNEIGMIRISAHPEADKPEEQHHNTQHAPHSQFLLSLHLLLFDLWGT